MTSAAFAMPDDRRQRVTIRRRATSASTETASAANEALQHVLDRRLRKREGRLPPPARQSAIGGASATVTASVGRLGLPQWLLRVAVLLGVALVLGAAVVTLARGRSSSHSVAGTVLVGKAPLAQATLSFHRTGAGGAEPVSLTTGADGSFQTADDRPLPAGLYAVVIEGGAGRQPERAGAIPPLYRDAATTPLRVLVTENLSGLRLLVRR